MVLRNECCICKGGLTTYYNLRKIPISICAVNKPTFNYADYNFSKCESCNTIQLRELIELDILYMNNHNLDLVGKVWKGHFHELKKMIEPKLECKNVLEFADPSAKLATLCKGYNKWYIMEPNYDEEKNNNKIIYIRDWFNKEFDIQKYKIEKIDIIVHSHFFEHLYDPNIFLQKMYEILNEGGDMFFSVPNMMYIAKNNLWPFNGIFFEHTYFLSEQNIEYILSRNGFNVVTRKYYMDHSIFYHCKKSTNKDIINLKLTKLKKDNKIYLETFHKSVIYLKTLVKSINEKIQNFNGDIYLFGCHYNSQIMICLGLKTNKIKGILDNSKTKQGKYLYSTSFLTFHPDIIKDNDDVMVIVNQGIYTSEIKSQLILINKKCLFI